MLNAHWHQGHPMPRPATTEQRVAWHVEHEKHCGCRPMPTALRALALAAKRRTGSGARSLRELLVGGDKRSLAQSNRALAQLRKEPGRIAELAELAADPDVLVVMRVMDLLEKLARQRPEWVEPHKQLFIGPLAQHERWEVRLQIVRALQLFTWNRRERKQAEAILLRELESPRLFVRAWAIDSLASLALENSALMPAVRAALSDCERSKSGALRSRARRIRARLAAAGQPL